MYSGIVQEIGKIESVQAAEGSNRLAISASSKFLTDLNVGASVAVNGTCLTMVTRSSTTFEAEATSATLAITNLEHLTVGSPVNLERSLRQGDENGGHALYGHISGVARIQRLKMQPAAELVIGIPLELTKYVFGKGFLGVNGMSLTVAAIDNARGLVHFNLIPETIRQSNVSDYKEGDLLNVEVDQLTVSIVESIAHAINGSAMSQDG